VARAWSNYNATSTPSQRANFNISSLTDLGTGSTRLTFTNAMPDANYSVVATSAAVAGFGGVIATASNYQTGSIDIKTEDVNNADRDSTIVNVAIFR
jgi:type IV secretory pathway TraG/TraD family ATPase VirD4